MPHALISVSRAETRGAQRSENRESVLCVLRDICGESSVSNDRLMPSILSFLSFISSFVINAIIKPVQSAAFPRRSSPCNLAKMADNPAYRGSRNRDTSRDPSVGMLANAVTPRGGNCQTSDEGALPRFVALFGGLNNGGSPHTTHRRCLLLRCVVELLVRAERGRSLPLRCLWSGGHLPHRAFLPRYRSVRHRMLCRLDASVSSL